VPPKICPDIWNSFKNMFFVILILTNCPNLRQSFRGNRERVHGPLAQSVSQSQPVDMHLIYVWYLVGRFKYAFDIFVVPDGMFEVRVQNTCCIWWSMLNMYLVYLLCLMECVERVLNILIVSDGMCSICI